MPEGDWWGYSPKHGWVVLDRSHPANQAAATKYHPLTFVRCDDWTEFTELKIRWDLPHFLFAPVYIRRLRGAAVEEAKARLKSLKDEWPSQKRRLDDDRRKAVRRRLDEEARALRRLDGANRQAKVEEKTAIREFILSREIKTIIHFTHIENLDSILDNGLLPRSMSKELGLDILTTDDRRLDHGLDAVNLSISFPNYKMFFKKQQKNTSKDWAVLCLQPDVLWEHECSFYSGNAADSSCRDKASGLRIRDLLDMFAEETVNCRGKPIDRSQLGIPTFYTTDPQAEVLAHGPINTNYIYGICFNSGHLRSAWEQKLASRLPPIKAYEFNQYFSPRVDFKHWPRKIRDEY